MASPARRLTAATEIGLILAFYQWYSAARHWVAGSDAAAFDNALALIRVEEALGLFSETTVQQWVLSHRWLVQLLGMHYTTFHFAVPVLLLVALYRRCPDRYLAHRNALAWMSMIGVVGFWVWPLMPPRLLPGSYGFVDVFATHFRPPSVDHGFAPALYNGFAAMPSLHFGYALWCVVAVWSLPSRTARALVAAHAAVTFVAIVATGNHFYLDAAGGAAALAGGVALARRRRLPSLIPSVYWAVGGLLGAALFIWVPKAQPMLVAEDVLVAVLVATAAIWRSVRLHKKDAPVESVEPVDGLVRTADLH